MEKINKERFFLIIFFISLIFLQQVSAHGAGEVLPKQKSLADLTNPILYIIISALWLIMLTAFLLTIGKNRYQFHKKIFFMLLILPVILSTIYLIGDTVYNSLTSESKGPVHWHADYKIFVCGEELDLADPTGLANRIGTSALHEHNDGRIHVEGTIKELDSVFLANYFAAIGGELEEDHLVYPTGEKIYDYKNNDLCQNGKKGTLKVYINGKKTENFEDHIIYPNSRVPPGDCIIVLFDETNEDTTNILCESWEVKSWDYSSFKRPEIKIGERAWE